MPTDCLLTLDEVLQVTKLTKSALYRYITAGDFPKPIKLGVASRWSSLDVQDWITRKRKEAESQDWIPKKRSREQDTSNAAA